MHRLGVIAFHKKRLVAVPDQQRFQFIRRHAGKDRGAGDLVSVEMQNRQDGAVARGVQEFIAVPTPGQRSGFRFSVADDSGHQ